MAAQLCRLRLCEPSEEALSPFQRDPGRSSQVGRPIPYPMHRSVTASVRTTLSHFEEEFEILSEVVESDVARESLLHHLLDLSNLGREGARRGVRRRMRWWTGSGEGGRWGSVCRASVGTFGLNSDSWRMRRIVGVIWVSSTARVSSSHTDSIVCPPE